MQRSDFLKSAATVVGASIIPSISFGSEPENENAPQLRFAFLTDIHIKHGIGAEAGMAKALHHAQARRPKVDFIINGGDSIMDSLAVDKENTRIQWDLYQTLLKKENSLPVYHCIGNHDVWGWFIKNGRPEADKLYGKQWAVEVLELPGRYYSFSRQNWHFIVLDSTQQNPAGGYIAYIDAEQLNWVKQELEKNKDKYICFVSHIPVLSICAGLFFNKTEENGDLRIQRNLMHTDFIELKKIFLQHPNVKVCLSGHIHLQDEVEYLGVKYYCNGAVSGNWWKGAFHDFEPAYAVIELYKDGTSARKMENYDKVVTGMGK